MNGIIYKVTNLVNGKIYIGQTVYSLAKRKSGHYADAKRSRVLGKKRRGHFTNGLLKYYKKDFKWEIVDKANNKEELNVLEEYYIKKYDSFKKGYNSTTGGNSRLLSDITKRKIGRQTKKRTGKKNFFYGKHHTKKTRKELSRLRRNATIKNKDIKKLHKDGYTRKEAAKKLGISYGTIPSRLPKLQWSNNAVLKRTKQIEEDKLLKAVNDGHTVKQIAEMFDCSTAVINRNISKIKNKIQRPKREISSHYKYKEIDSNKLINLISDDYTIKQIASYFDVSPNTILRRKKELKLQGVL